MLLCSLLKYALACKEAGSIIDNYTKDELRHAVEIAAKHRVLPLLYDTLNNAGKGSKLLENTALQTVQQSYHLLFLSKYVQRLLYNNGIMAILLKGCSTAVFYPVPELRKSGDIDLLLKDRKQVQRACKILKEAGFNIKEEQHAQHHIVCTSPDGIDVELHSLLAEPFDNKRINRYLENIKEDIFKNACTSDVMGIKLLALGKPFHAFYLLLHMLQHFLRSGCGLKLICDWVVFWNGEILPDEKDKFLMLVKESGIYGFAKMVTDICIYYLGLDKNKVLFITNFTGFSKNALNNYSRNKKSQAGIIKDNTALTEFMEEIFEAGEFGKSSPDRMVALRGTGLMAYVREFHHQMQLNYPKASKIVILWPFLWIMAFTGFIFRNKNIRNVPASAIIKKAAQRSRIVEKMELFKKM